MSVTRKYLAVSFLGLGLCVSTVAGAREVVGSVRCNMTKLNLTEAQKKQIREFRTEKRPTKEEMRKEWTVYRQQTETIIRQKSFDEKKAQSLINGKLTKEADVQLEHLKARHAFFQILNDQQKAIWLKECSLEAPPTH